MEPILTSKLHIPPTHPHRISRTHLIQKLDEDLWYEKNKQFLRCLTLIAAPAGYGKSTLLSEWIGTHKIPAVWITFDESDNDPIRFLQYLIAALQIIHPGFGTTELAIMQSLQTTDSSNIVDSIISSLVNEIGAIHEPFFLVFDDYHTLQDQRIHQAVKFMLDHLPENLSMVIATRADPSLPLSRLRARRRMIELRANDLQFSNSEAAAFFCKVMHLDLRDAEIATLTENTEGWIAGLQMAGLALQGQDDPANLINNFNGRERYIIDYFFDEVLSRQPDEIQSFLVRTSILERMSGPLCDSVLGNQSDSVKTDRVSSQPKLPASQEILEYLERSNLFLVPLDHERNYFRYHHLFADLLHQRLNRYSPDLVPVLHARAAQWFDGQREYSAAFNHWIAAKEYVKASDLITRNSYRLVKQGNISLLLAWLQKIPEDIIYSQPWLCIFNSWVLIFTGRYSGAETYLSTAEKILLPIDELASPEVKEQYGHVAAVREYLASRSLDGERIAYYANLALKYVAEDDLYIRSIISLFLGAGRLESNQYDLAQEAWIEAAQFGKAAGNTLMAVIALCSLAELIRVRGKLHNALEIYQEAAQLACDDKGKPYPVAAEVFVGRARLFYEWQDFQAAEADLKAASQIFKLYPNFDLQVDYSIALARLRVAQGQVDEANRLIHEIRQSNRQANARATAALLAARIHLLRENGDLAAARQLMNRQDWEFEGKNLFTWADAFIEYFQILAMQGDVDSAIHKLEEYRLKLETDGLYTPATKANIVQACLLDRKGEHNQALKSMQRALTLAEPEEYLRLFIDVGEAVKSLIEACVADGISKTDMHRWISYKERLLSAFQSSLIEEAIPLHEKVTPATSLIEPLTERELEVLQLITDGFSNKEIASKLVVSIGTVKTHTSNIYRKLDVPGRGKAMAKARELRLTNDLPHS